MDPFVDRYRLVYPLTMRTVGCEEVAGDQNLLLKTLGILEGIEGADPRTKLLFP
jgi:sterol 14-demethylase